MKELAAIDAKFVANQWKKGFELLGPSIPSPMVQISETTYMLRMNLNNPFSNICILHDMHPKEAEAALDPLLLPPTSSFLSAVIPPFKANNVMNMLEDKGFEAAVCCSMMSVDLSLLCEPSFADGSSCSVGECSDADYDTWCQVAAAGLDVPVELMQYLTGGKVNGHRYYWGKLNDEIVSTSTLVFSDGVACIYNVCTLENSRKKGLGSAVTLLPLIAAREMGYKAAILQSTPHAVSMYERLGFRKLGELPLYVRSPPACTT